MKKIISIILVIMMVLSMLVACDGNDNVIGDTSDTSLATGEPTTEAATEAATEETTQEVTTEAETEAPVVLNEYDLSKFKIVYTGSHLADLAEEFKTQIKVKTGLELEVVASADAKDEGGYELLVGNTDRDISKTCFGDFTTFKYSTSKGVYCENGKVQMLGIDRITIRDSIKHFLANSFVEGKAIVNIPDVGAVSEKINLSNYDLVAKSSPSYVRFITNNILMHSLTDKWGVPATQNRMSELMGAYALYDADIIAFQEVDTLWYTVHKLVNNMKSLGYSYASISKIATYSSAIFYKTERFELLETNSVTYDSSMLPGGPLEARRYTYAVLEEKATGKKIVASSTHFVASLTGVTTEVCDLYRQESARQQLAFAEEMTTKYPGAVVMLAGDYNSGLDTEAHRIMSEGLLSARDHAEKTANMAFYTTCGIGQRPKKAKDPKVIDHVFYSKEGVTAKFYEVLVSRYSYAYADHVPVLVDFELK